MCLNSGHLPFRTTRDSFIPAAGSPERTLSGAPAGAVVTFDELGGVREVR
jgi:hypothetical protein